MNVTITLQPSGWSFDADTGTTLLQAAERAGIELPNACRNGTCRTCLCRLGAGLDGSPDTGASVRYLVEWPGLSFDEKREGYILPCVAVACANIVVDQRLARRRPPE